jgi:hypothetical protein
VAKNPTASIMCRPKWFPSHTSRNRGVGKQVNLTLAADTRNRRRAPAVAANHTHGMLRRLGRIALWVISGFIIGSILLVALYRYLPSCPASPRRICASAGGRSQLRNGSPFLSAPGLRASTGR